MRGLKGEFVWGEPEKQQARPLEIVAGLERVVL